MSGMRRAAAALCCAVGLVRAAGAQAVPPSGRWLTITTPHFRVSFLAALEPQGRRAAAEAEIAYAKLARHLKPPRGTVDLVVADNVDLTNGYTTVFPTNRITIYILPPLDRPSLEFYDDWFEEIETHELTHAFHLDRSAGWWEVAQDVFGRAPLLFPNGWEPAWMIEGLAVYYESALTGAGRVKGTTSETVVRSTAKRGDFPYYDRWSLATTQFPYGDIPYDYGAEFLNWIAVTRGDTSLPKLVERTSHRPVPFFYNGAAEGAFGITFADAWKEWRDSMARAVRGLASPAEPMAGWRDLTRDGHDAIRPRWTDDGSLVYVGNLGKSFTEAYALDTSGARRAIGRRNTEDTNVPVDDGSILFAQLEYGDPYHVRSDLYRQRGDRVERLTVGARLAQPDVRDDGSIVAVRYEPATMSLVRVSRDGRTITPVTGVAPDTEWAEPRWSPDGHRIAATRWTHGGYADVVVLDTTGRIVRTFTHDRAYDGSAAWSPDGKAVLFSSNRTGVTDLYVALVEGDAPPRLISHATSALQYPSLAADGRTLVAVRYDADGQHIGIAPLDTARAAPAAIDTIFAATAHAAAAIDTTPAHAYSPFPGLWPHYWLPLIGLNTLNGVTLGAYTSGQDVIARHTYYAQALLDPWHYQNSFQFGYAYAGLAQPILTFSGQQYWDQFPVFDSAGFDVGSLFRRSRRLDLGVTLRRFRVYSTAFLTFDGGLLDKAFTTTPDSLLGLLSSYYQQHEDFWTLGASAGYANAVQPLAGVSPEDGISTVVAGDWQWLDGESALWSQTLQASFAAYVALSHGSFAHPVLRGRVAVGDATGSNPAAFSLGGVSGGGTQILPGVVLGSPRFYPVRGFAAGVEAGERVLAGSAELVLPLAALHHGFGFFPLFLDRSSLTLFADAGSAWTYPTSSAQSTAIASVGAEATIFVGVPYDYAYALRIGVAAPVLNRSNTSVPAATFYVTLGGF